MGEREPQGPPWTLDAFRAEAAGWLGRAPDGLAALAWRHEPGRPPEPCALADADALSLPRAEYDPAADDAPAAEAPAWAATPEPDAAGTEPVTLDEMRVVYALAERLLGWHGAVVASSSRRAWTAFREG